MIVFIITTMKSILILKKMNTYTYSQTLLSDAILILLDKFSLLFIFYVI